MYLFCSDSNRISLPLAYSSRFSGSMKCPSMALTLSLLFRFLRHIDAHGKCYVLKFPCHGNDGHAFFVGWDCKGISLILAYSFRISGSMKFPSMTLTSCFFGLKHIDTHHKCYVSKFSCPENPERVFFLFGFQSYFLDFGL